MPKKPFLKRDLRDSPFSIERLFVWAIAFYGLTGMIGMIVLALSDKQIPDQLMTTTAVCVGILGGRIERGTKSDI